MAVVAALALFWLGAVVAWKKKFLTGLVLMTAAVLIGYEQLLRVL